MIPIVFTGMLVQSVSPAEAAAADLAPDAAARQVDALIRSLADHFDREAVEPLQTALTRHRARLVAIRSSALLRMAIDELTIQAGDPALPNEQEALRDAA